MSSYAELLAEPEPTPKRHLIQSILDRPPEDESESLRKLLLSQHTADWLAQQMKERGDVVAPSTITSWRRKHRP